MWKLKTVLAMVPHNGLMQFTSSESVRRSRKAVVADTSNPIPLTEIQRYVVDELALSVINPRVTEAMGSDIAFAALGSIYLSVMSKE